MRSLVAVPIAKEVETRTVMMQCGLELVVDSFRQIETGFLLSELLRMNSMVVVAPHQDLAPALL